MEDLGIKAFDSQGKMLPLKNLIEQFQVSTSKLTDEQKQQAIATIFGQEAMSGMLSLIQAGSPKLDTLTQSLKNSDGAAAGMAATMKDNAKASVEEMMGSIETAGIKIGQSLAPSIIKVSDSIGKMADKFAEISPSTQSAIINTTALAVGLGGLLLVGGKVVSGVGSIIGVAGTLATAFGGATVAAGATATAAAGVGTAATVATGGGLAALATGLGGVVVASLPFVGAGLAIAGVGYAIHKDLTESAIPAVDLFADKVETTASTVTTATDAMNGATDTFVTTISNSTKEAVGAYIDLDDQATNALNGLYINSTEITEKTKTEIVGKYAEMGKQVTSQLEKDKSEQLKTLQDYFGQSSALSDSEEQAILSSTTQHYSDKQKVVADAQSQISAILERASSENRAITKQEQQEINNIQKEQRTNAVKTLSENEVEAQVILQRMKDYDGTVTAEQASQHIQTLNKQRDGAIKTANEEYSERIATIVRMRDEAGVISAEQADALIADAKRQRDGIITEAEATRNGAVSKIASMNSELQNSVDLATGSILTKWDKLKNWWAGWKPENKTFTTTHIDEYITKKTAGNGNPRLLDNPNINAGTPSWGSIPQRWTGDNNFQGGLTTLHEKGYEVYQLERGTRIYNHEASVDQVMKTAEATARKIVSNSQGSGGITQTVNIHSTAPLSPSEIARRFKNVNKELALGI